MQPDKECRTQYQSLLGYKDHIADSLRTHRGEALKSKHLLCPGPTCGNRCSNCSMTRSIVFATEGKGGINKAEKATLTPGFIMSKVNIWSHPRKDAW